MNHHKTPFE